MTLQDIFVQHFQRDDLEGAKKWFSKWLREDGQHIPELFETHGEGPQFTQRAMAGHLSDYLEGYTGQEPESYDGSQDTQRPKVYFDTRYGSELYNAV